MSTKGKTKSPTKAPASRPRGRPSADPAAVARGLAILETGDAEGAQAESGLSLATLYRARGKAAPAAAREPKNGLQTLNTLGFGRSILAALHPEALCDFEDGLAAHAAGGDAALAAWLERPRAAELAPEDTLAVARRVLAGILRRLGTASDTRFGWLSEKALSAVKSIEQIESRRPQPPKPDVVLEQLRALDGESIGAVEQHLGEADRALEERMGRLRGFAAQLHPALGAELGALLDGLFAPAAP